jgi:outer membrane protein TolC
MVCALVGLLSGKLAAQPDDRTLSTPVKTETVRPPVEPLLLHALIEEALAQNPEIIAMRRNFDLLRARVPQAKALPEPLLNFGYTGNAVPLPPFDIQKGDPASARVVSVTQEIPYPGKLAIKGKMANVAAEAEWWNYEQVQWNVIAEVKDVYYDLSIPSPKCLLPTGPRGALIGFINLTTDHRYLAHASKLSR